MKKRLFALTGFCFSLLMLAAPPRASADGTPLGDNVDPIALMKAKVPAAASVLDPLSGLLSLDGAIEEAASAGRQITIKGALSQAKMSAGNAQSAAVKGLIATTSKIFGLGEKVGLEAYVSTDNAQIDIGIGVTIADGFYQSPELVPLIGTKFATKDAKVFIHLIQPLAGAPTTTAQLAGTFYVQPTNSDPWLAVSPSLEYDMVQQRITFGGSLSGSCGNAISAGTAPAACTAEWNVLNKNVLYTTGGLLYVTMDPLKTPAVVTGVQAALNSARFAGKGGTLEMSGAVLWDVDASPGTGFALTTSQTITPVQLLQALPFASTEPLATVISSMSPLAGAGMMPSGVSWITVAPTGLQVGSINIPGPTFRFGGEFSTALATGMIDASIGTDISDVLAGKLDASTDIHLKISMNFLNIAKRLEDEIRQDPVFTPIVADVVNTFQFQSAELAMEPLGKSYGKVRFKVFGKQVDEQVSLDILFRPDKLTPWIARKIQHMAGDLGKIILKGMEGAANTIAKGGSVALKDIASGFDKMGAGVQDFGNKLDDAINDIFKGIGGIFGGNKGPSDGEVIRAGFPIQAFWLEGWFQPMHNPNDGDRSRNYLLFISPFYKDFNYGWSQWFDPAFYLDNNPGVLAWADRNKATLDADLKDKKPYKWFQPGESEMPKNYNPTAHYKAGQPPYATRSRYQPHQLYGAFKHWMNDGLDEGRTGNKYFSAQYYYFRYQDVARAKGNEGMWGAIEHYVSNGFKEKRAGVPQAPNWKGRMPNGQNVLGCRALHNNNLYLGTWRHATGTPLCEVNTGGGIIKSPVFDVFYAVTVKPYGAGVNPPIQDGFNLAAVAYPQNAPAVAICTATTEGQLHYGWLNPSGACLIPSANGAAPVAGENPQILMAKGMRWIFP